MFTMCMSHNTSPFAYQAHTLITRLVSVHSLRILPVLCVMKSMHAFAIFILSWFLNKNSVSNRKHRFLLSLYYHLLGSLSNNDDNSNESITKNTNLRPFKLYGVYLEPLNSSKVGDFSWSGILKGFIHVQTEKGKFVVVCPHPP